MSGQQRKPRPRWVLPIWDCFAWVASFAAFAALRFDGYLWDVPWGSVLASAAIVSAVFVSVAGAMRMYDRRHAVGSLDESLTLVMISGLVGLLATSVLAFMGANRPIPLSLPLSATGTAIVLIVGLRVGYRIIQDRLVVHSGSTRAAIVGAGNAGTQLVRGLLVDGHATYDPILFVDDNPRKRHFRVGPVRVEGTVADLGRLVSERGIDQIIIAAPGAGAGLVHRVSEVAAATGVRAKALPTLAELAGREDVGVSDIRDLQLSDFLRRAPVETDLGAVRELISGRRVLVTGAGGSIGSELCRQISRLEPSHLVMLDRDESALHALQLSLDGRGLLEDPGLVLADIRDPARMNEVFLARRPQIVFHAAALKHLTLLQRNPEEGIKTNVVGTANVLNASSKAGVEVFVNISTDKAADPTSVLGETKRTAEGLTAGAAASSGARFLSVRFGNVLGTRGSVLTAFSEQIRSGGPLTVTHPEVTRYFMTVEEAVQLVLQAAALGEPAETMILDMGQPVRILDVAHQMIALSGRNIDIEFTGLRPGEKLHENLEGHSEILEETAHPLISRTVVPILAPSSVTSTGTAEVVPEGCQAGAGTPHVSG